METITLDLFSNQTNTASVSDKIFVLTRDGVLVYMDSVLLVNSTILMNDNMAMYSENCLEQYNKHNYNLTEEMIPVITLDVDEDCLPKSNVDTPTDFINLINFNKKYNIVTDYSYKHKWINTIKQDIRNNIKEFGYILDKNHTSINRSTLIRLKFTCELFENNKRQEELKDIERNDGVHISKYRQIGIDAYNFDTIRSPPRSPPRTPVQNDSTSPAASSSNDIVIDLNTIKINFHNRSTSYLLEECGVNLRSFVESNFDKINEYYAIKLKEQSTDRKLLYLEIPDNLYISRQGQCKSDVPNKFSFAQFQDMPELLEKNSSTKEDINGYKKTDSGAIISEIQKSFSRENGGDIDKAGTPTTEGNKMINFVPITKQYFELENKDYQNQTFLNFLVQILTYDNVTKKLKKIIKDIIKLFSLDYKMYYTVLNNTRSFNLIIDEIRLLKSNFKEVFIKSALIYGYNEELTSRFKNNVSPRIIFSNHIIHGEYESSTLIDCLINKDYSYNPFTVSTLSNSDKYPCNMLNKPYEMIGKRGIYNIQQFKRNLSIYSEKLIDNIFVNNHFNGLPLAAVCGSAITACSIQTPMDSWSDDSCNIYYKNDYCKDEEIASSSSNSSTYNVDYARKFTGKEVYFEYCYPSRKSSNIFIGSEIPINDLINSSTDFQKSKYDEFIKNEGIISEQGGEFSDIDIIVDVLVLLKKNNIELYNTVIKDFPEVTDADPAEISISKSLDSMNHFETIKRSEMFEKFNDIISDQMMIYVQNIIKNAKINNTPVYCLPYVEKIDGKAGCRFKIRGFAKDIEIFPSINISLSIMSFHLSCVRAYYDGDDVKMFPSFISTAYTSFINFPYAVYSKRRNVVEIIMKYYQRGFSFNLTERENYIVNKYINISSRTNGKFPSNGSVEYWDKLKAREPSIYNKQHNKTDFWRTMCDQGLHYGLSLNKNIFKRTNNIRYFYKNGHLKQQLNCRELINRVSTLY